MRPFVVQWTQSGEERIEHLLRPSRILARLHELHRLLSAAPAIISIGRDFEAGPTLGIGLGRRMSVVTFQSDLDPPYFISLGQNHQSSEIFEYGGQQSEYLGRNLVPVDTAVAAVAEFLQNEKRPTTLSWEQL